MELNHDIALITTIPGIGVLTSAVIMAESNGFELIRNASQLASYAGFDVKKKKNRPLHAVQREIKNIKAGKQAFKKSDAYACFGSDKAFRAL